MKKSEVSEFDLYAEAMRYGVGFELALYLGRVLCDRYDLKKGYISRSQCKRRIRYETKQLIQRISKILPPVEKDILATSDHFYTNSELKKLISNRVKEVDPMHFDLDEVLAQRILERERKAMARAKKLVIKI